MAFEHERDVSDRDASEMEKLLVGGADAEKLRHAVDRLLADRKQRIRRAVYITRVLARLSKGAVFFGDLAQKMRETLDEQWCGAKPCALCGAPVVKTEQRDGKTFFLHPDGTDCSPQWLHGSPHAVK